MPTVLQINVTANWGSTGMIAEQIGQLAKRAGWVSYIAYGRYANPSELKLIRVGSRLTIYEHYIESKVLDNEGLASRMPTQWLIKKINEIHPDVVHLHNIHDHWLNYRILFEYLNSTEIRVVWTFHDFWAVTGGCAHFVNSCCLKWQNVCDECPAQKSGMLPGLKKRKANFLLKKRLFSTNRHLTVVCVSDWVRMNVQKSFLKNKDIRVINNGVDLAVFRPNSNTCMAHIPADKFVIFAASTQWNSNGKGLKDYIAMSAMLQEDEIIALAGITGRMASFLPENIIAIPRTNNKEELAALFSRANVVTSFSSAETFGLTIVEGFACGTPAVVYDNTAPPSLITPDVGFVVPDKDYVAAYKKIQEIKKVGKLAYSTACRLLAEEKFDRKNCFERYINLYNSFL